MIKIIIYTDGACSGNGTATAQGGFAVVVMDEEDNIVKAHAFHNENTTNNKEELRAIVFALAAYGKGYDAAPIVYSDSAYAVNTFNIWMWNWARNDWLKSNNRPPENLDIIQDYYKLWNNMGHRIELRKCPGHSNIKGNEIADKLAKSRVKQ